MDGAELFRSRRRGRSALNKSVTRAQFGGERPSKPADLFNKSATLALAGGTWAGRASSGRSRVVWMREGESDEEEKLFSTEMKRSQPLSTGARLLKLWRGGQVHATTKTNSTPSIATLASIMCLRNRFAWSIWRDLVWRKAREGTRAIEREGRRLASFYAPSPPRWEIKSALGHPNKCEQQSSFFLSSSSSSSSWSWSSGFVVVAIKWHWRDAGQLEKRK